MEQNGNGIPGGQENPAASLLEQSAEISAVSEETLPTRESLNRKAPSAARLALGLLIFLLVCAAVIAGGIIPRMQARAALREETDRLAVPAVTIVHPAKAAMTQEVILPANIEAYTTAPIYARTSGYLKHWDSDIGTHVKAGQLLAEIESPEVDQQLQQAMAGLGAAQANLHLAQTTSARYQDLLKTESVAKQDADNAVGNLEARQADVQAAQANVRRLQEMKSFERIEAPFDGVITARNIDVGMLIDAGGSPARELFHISDTRRLRVHVSIPQAYSPVAKPGLKAELALPELPGRRFGGTLVRTADVIDPASRTLLAEFEVPNPGGVLLPGAYAELHFKLPEGHPVWLVPINTLLFRAEGLRVVAVDGNNRTVLVPVTLGRDTGKFVEVLTGLKGDESLIVDPSDSILAGQPVRIVQGANSPAGTNPAPGANPGKEAKSGGGAS